MKRLRSFFGITLLGGFMVVLPGAILVLFAEWIFGVVSRLINLLMIGSPAGHR